MGGQTTCCSSVPSAPPRAAPPKAPPARPSPPSRRQTDAGRIKAAADTRPRFASSATAYSVYKGAYLATPSTRNWDTGFTFRRRQRASKAEAKCKIRLYSGAGQERVPRCAVLQARGRAERARADWGNHEYEYALAASTRQSSDSPPLPTSPSETSSRSQATSSKSLSVLGLPITLALTIRDFLERVRERSLAPTPAPLRARQGLCK